MIRKAQLLIIMHLYAIFAVWHLCTTETGMLVIVLSHVVPNMILSWMLLILVLSRSIRLDMIEKSAIIYTVILATFYHAYIALCGFSAPDWIWKNNIKSGIFIAITIIFYSTTLYKLKREQQQ